MCIAVRDRALEGYRTMPVHGAKVESQCLNMCTRVEPFLGMGLLGKGREIPAGFWQELATNHEAVSK